MCNYSIINVYNKRIKVSCDTRQIEDIIPNKTYTDFISELEELIEEGYNCGEVFGINWTEIETRNVLIKGTFFEIESSITNKKIHEVLTQVENNLVSFEHVLEKDFYIDQICYDLID